MPSDEYLIRVSTSKLVFPTKCPVCGEPTDSEGTIPAISASDRKIGQQRTQHTSFAASGYYAIPRSTPDYNTATPFAIPTCERHAIKFEEMKRYSAPCGIISGILAVVTLFLVISILGSFAIGEGIRLTDFFFLSIAIVGFFIASGLGGQTELEKKFTIIDGSPNSGSMIIRLRNSDYAEELLHLNTMTAERVMPIHRER